MGAERRAKIHFRREDPFALFCLARRGDFRLGKTQHASQQNALEEKQFAKVRFEKNERTRRWSNGLKSRTAGVAFFVTA